MRAIWKGAVTFGLVNVPVKVYSATEDHDLSLHQVHDADGGRIRYQRKCEICGQIVSYDHIDKAFQDGEQTVVLTADDLASLPEERSREIEVVEFVPSDDLDPIMFERSYYLEPDSASSKAYVLLRRTLEETERTAIVRFALRQKTRLGALRVREDVIVLQSLLWEDEVREVRFPALEETIRISAKELEMSEALVDSFSSRFRPDVFVDEYQAQLRKLIEAKLEQGDALDTAATFGEQPETEEGDPAEPIDLMAVLQRSIERQRDAKKPAGGTAAAKKTAAKQPAAKKTAAKQPTAKKPAATKAKKSA